MCNAGILLIDNNKEAQEAYNYFGVLRNGEDSLKKSESASDFNGANKYGMVDVVGLTNKEASLKRDGVDLSSTMESLSNILIAAVIKHAGEDEKEKVSHTAWKKGFDALVSLFFSAYSIDVLKYSDKKVGKETIAKIIEIAFDVNGEPPSTLKTAIEKYLTKQGAVMNKMGYDGKVANPYTLLGFSNFVNNGIHTCSLRAYFTDFDVNGVKITQTCNDDKTVFGFSFEVVHCNADFMLSNWDNNPGFRAKLLKFIEDHKADTDYFDTFETGHKFIV